MPSGQAQPAPHSTCRTASCPVSTPLTAAAAAGRPPPGACQIDAAAAQRLTTALQHALMMYALTSNGFSRSCRKLDGCRLVQGLEQRTCDGQLSFINTTQQTCVESGVRSVCAGKCLANKGGLRLWRLPACPASAGCTPGTLDVTTAVSTGLGRLGRPGIVQQPNFARARRPPSVWLASACSRTHTHHGCPSPRRLKRKRRKMRQRSK